MTIETLVLIILLGVASLFGFDIATEPISTGDPTELVEQEVLAPDTATATNLSVDKKVEVGWHSQAAGAVFKDWNCVAESNNYRPEDNCFRLEDPGR